MGTDDHTDLFDENAAIRQEIDKRVAARTVLWQIKPPDDLSYNSDPDPIHPIRRHWLTG